MEKFETICFLGFCKECDTSSEIDYILSEPDESDPMYYCKDCLPHGVYKIEKVRCGHCYENGVFVKLYSNYCYSCFIDGHRAKKYKIYFNKEIEQLKII